MLEYVRKVVKPMKKLNITVENVDGGCLLKDYLRACGYTVTFIKKVKLSGIELCGVPVTVRAVVKNGDVIALTLPEEKSDGIPPISIPLDVLYEDEYILAVDKPRNMPTHPSKGNSLPTLANAVMAHKAKIPMRLHNFIEDLFP